MASNCKVYEVGGKIPYEKDKHINFDGSCCLTVWLSSWKWSQSGIMLLPHFIEEYVISFFAWQTWYIQYNEIPPWGEYSHINGKEEAIKDNSQRKIGRNDTCPCGSGKKHKNCHLTVF